jgi:SAM-dependent methyltransferase
MICSDGAHVNAPSVRSTIMSMPVLGLRVRARRDKNSVTLPAETQRPLGLTKGAFGDATLSITAGEPPSARVALPFRVVYAIVNGIFRVAPGAAPALQNGLVRAGYNIVSAFGRESDILLNFGYASPAGHPGTIELDAADESNRFGFQLYHRVAGAMDLRGKTVLEVGSGRGGGASFVLRHLAPASVTGVDFSPKAVAFCRTRHPLKGLTFLEGDAQELPFPDDSFDVVLNIESSHSYPSFERFLKEVSRVLRKGGVFLFADLRLATGIADLLDQFQVAGLHVIEQESLTSGVLRSLTLDSPARRARAQQAPRVVRSAVTRFSGVEGSPSFEALRVGQLEYLRFVLQK